MHEARLPANPMLSLPPLTAVALTGPSASRNVLWNARPFRSWPFPHRTEPLFIAPFLCGWLTPWKFQFFFLHFSPVFHILFFFRKICFPGLLTRGFSRPLVMPGRSFARTPAAPGIDIDRFVLWIGLDQHFLNFIGFLKAHRMKITFFQGLIRVVLSTSFFNSRMGYFSRVFSRL